MRLIHCMSVSRPLLKTSAAPARPPASAPLRLNLAALTAEELQHLLGQEAAQRMMPEVSQARLEGRVLAGDVILREQEYQSQVERGWGKTPELARQLSGLRGELTRLGGTDLGVYYLPQLAEVRHLRAFLFAPDTALALRWSETPGSARAPAPFLLAATLLRDRASGTAAVLSGTSSLPFVPTQSEEIDARLYQGAAHPSAGPGLSHSGLADSGLSGSGSAGTPHGSSAQPLSAQPLSAQPLAVQALLEAHRLQVARHGRGVRLGLVAGNEYADWLKVFATVRQVNLAAWTRRGLLVEGG